MEKKKEKEIVDKRSEVQCQNYFLYTFWFCVCVCAYMCGCVHVPHVWILGVICRSQFSPSVSFCFSFCHVGPGKLNSGGQEEASTLTFELSR